MYLYGREEGKIGLFDKGVADASEYPKVSQGRRKSSDFTPERRRFGQTLRSRRQLDVSIADQARSHAVQGLQIQLIVGLYRNATCRWPLHGFRDRVRIPEIVLVTLTERLGINRWHLLHVMTERD